MMRTEKEGEKMSSNVNVNIRMDRELKQQFEAFCKDMGLSMSTAITLFARKTVRDYRLPFIIGADLPNAETRQAIRDVREGKGLSRGFSSVKDLMEDLDADD